MRFEILDPKNPIDDLLLREKLFSRSTVSEKGTLAAKKGAILENRVQNPRESIYFDQTWSFHFGAEKAPYTIYIRYRF